MERFAKSLTFKIGIIIILIEVVILAGLGLYYIKRFSTEIEDRVILQMGIPGKLMTRGLLSYESVDDKEIMEKLVGEELLEGLVIGVNKKVFWSLNPEYRGKKITEIPGFELPEQTLKNAKESITVKTLDEKNNYLVNITPLSLEDGKLIGYLYIKAGTGHIKNQKGIITMIFIVSSVICVVLTSIGIIFSFNLVILKRIKSLLLFISGVEAGDLTSRVEEPISQDEIGNLQKGVNSMVNQLQETFGKLEQWVSDLKLAEEQIKTSLREKEVLLKEIHHRVKNNMQVISSLLSLQSNQIRDKQAFHMFKESQDRVRSMALVHEKLYQSQDLAKINFAEYLQSLAQGLFRSYGIDPKKIGLNVNAEDVLLSIDLAVPCGLIINELVSNSLKHAFPSSWKKSTKIEISLLSSDSGKIEFKVEDNGIGIPKHIDFRNTDSLGLHLVTILVEDQLQGKISLDRNQGTKFQINFQVQDVRDEELTGG